MPPSKHKRTERKLSAIEDFRFHARMPSLAAAARELNKARCGFGEKCSVATINVAHYRKSIRHGQTFRSLRRKAQLGPA
jgi:hypothetical protein